MRDLSRRLITLEAKAGYPGECFYVFRMPSEDTAAALARTFGPAGAPPGATVTLFSWLPVQGIPSGGYRHRACPRLYPRYIHAPAPRTLPGCPCDLEAARLGMDAEQSRVGGGWRSGFGRDAIKRAWHD